MTPLDKPEPYSVAVTFAGDEPTYESSNTSADCTVNKEDTKLTYTGPAPSTTMTCGSNWTTTGGDSPPPATSVLSYMGVVVAGSATKSGSTISGNSVHIVVVKVDPSYAPNPMSHGTGTIVATFC